MKRSSSPAAFLVATIVAVAFATVGVLATVTFDPATGTGFVGKGDVQVVLNLNNAQMQTLADSHGVNFTFEKVDTYEVVNAWATGNPDQPVSLNYHQATVTTTVGVNSVVSNDPRIIKGQKQSTGFLLTGFTNTVTNGVVPVATPTVTYVTFSWTSREWDGTYDTVPNPNYNGHNSETIQVKHFVTVTHTSDELPAYSVTNADGTATLTLYTEGDNQAVLSVTLVSSLTTLKVNGVVLQ